MTTAILIGATGILLIGSVIRDRRKTIKGLRGAKNMLLAMGPELVGVLALVALVLAFIPEATIARLLGGSDPWKSGLAGAVIGTITIIPAFVAFPLGGSLVDGGAALTSVAAFITTLTMVGFATLPIEIRHFGARFATVRNLLSFLFALLIAIGMGMIL